MLIKTKNKVDFLKSYINSWVKDKSKYCNNCGMPFNGVIACCDNPHIVNNATVTKLIIEQNRRLAKTRKNDYASIDDKSMRQTISLPPKLYRDLEKKCRNDYDEKLFKNNKELHKFMREFPEFTIPKRI